MNRALDKLWDEAAANPGKRVDIGRTVVCDSCSGDFTDSNAEGGIIFGSYAYCPGCTQRALPEIQEFGEEHFIRSRCPLGVSFADFVREYRGPNHFISIGSLL